MKHPESLYLVTILISASVISMPQVISAQLSPSAGDTGAQNLTGAGAAGTTLSAPSRTIIGDEINAQARAALKRGLDWLKANQRPDGSWSNPNFPALTALALWAFARSDHSDRAAVCEKAATFVAGQAQADGGIYRKPTGGRGSGGLATYNTAICMMALHAWDQIKYGPIILAARKFVAESQLVGDSSSAGGFGYERIPATQIGIASGAEQAARGDLSNTAWALQAMRFTQDVEDLRPNGTVDVNWSLALKFIERLQNKDEADENHYGGFGYSTRGERAGTVAGSDSAVRLATFGSMTYAGLEALIYAQVDRSDPRVQSAVQWAARHWSVDENPGMGARGLFYYYTVMAKALTAAGVNEIVRPSGETVQWKKQLVEKLIQLQRPEGSWVNSDNTFWENDAVLVSSYAALTLEYILGW
ncbi:MAG: prenyltransferase/squalene oxidase repeat-containing protein [Kiritimatiellia bacterium]